MIDEEMLMTDYMFSNFQRDPTIDEETGSEIEPPFVYEACSDVKAARDRAYLKLDAYNEKFPVRKMGLVMFDDALAHLLRITRVLGTPAGNMLLVGVGGSGKQSLTRLGAFIENCSYDQIKLNKSFGMKDFLEFIREHLYAKCADFQKNPKSTFILTDAEIKSEMFLEKINSMLATGDIPGLLGKDEKEMYPVQVKTVYQKEERPSKNAPDPSKEEMWQYFMNRVKDNLHTVLAFSPMGPKFRERAQKFPSLFSQCTIDWFLQWPLDALIDVSKKIIGKFELVATKEVKHETV